MDNGVKMSHAVTRLVMQAREILRNDLMICWGGPKAIAALYMCARRYLVHYFGENKTPEIREWLSEQKSKTPSDGSIIGCSMSIIEYCANGAAAVTEKITGASLDIDTIRHGVQLLQEQERKRGQTMSEYVGGMMRDFNMLRTVGGQVPGALQYIENSTANGDLDISTIAAQKTLGMGRMSVTVECILNEHLQMVLRIPAHERSITLMLAHANTLYEKLKREDKNARHLTRRRTKGNKVTMAAVLAGQGKTTPIKKRDSP